MNQIREDIKKYMDALTEAKKPAKPSYDEEEYHNYTIRTKTAPDGDGYFKSIAFHNQMKDRKQVVKGKSVEDAKKNAIEWVSDFSEQRTWDDVSGSGVTVDFNSSFIQDDMENEAAFWSKFTVIDGRPVMVIAPENAEADYGVDTLRDEGYSKSSRKPSQKGADSNTAVTSIKKSRAVQKLLKPNARYTLSYSGKKTENVESDIYTLVFHSFVDAPNAPMRLNHPGVTIAASRQKVKEADDKPRDEHGRVKGNIKYDMSAKADKIVANLKGHESGSYTKLGQKIEKIDALSKEVKELRAEVKEETREKLTGLFSAEDAVRLRVVETLQFTFTISKDPKVSETPQYKKILEELEKDLTPDLIKVLESLKEKYVTKVQKEPAVRVKRTDGSQVKEGVMDDVKSVLNTYKEKVIKWLGGYDRKLDKLKAIAGE